MSGGSARPCQRPSRFQSVSPCRARRIVVTIANVAPRWISGSATRCASSPGRRPGSASRSRGSCASEGALIVTAGRRDGGIGDLHVAGDLAQPGEPERLVAATLERFGRVDCVVNNVGGTAVRALAELTDADWQRSFELNLMSAVRATQAALPSLREHAAA